MLPARLGASLLALYFVLPLYASAGRPLRLVVILGINLWCFLVNDRHLPKLEPWSRVLVDGLSVGALLFVAGRVVISLRLGLGAALWLGGIVAITEWIIYRIYPVKEG